MTLMFMCAALSAGHFDFKQMIPHGQSAKVSVHPLGSQQMSTEHLMFINKSAELVINTAHTERIYVLTGVGVVTLDEQVHCVKQGDFIEVPTDLTNITVRFDQDVKVLSVQAS